MSATVDKIERILTEEHSVGNYVDLMTEILDALQIVAPNNPKKEYTNFSSHIESYTHVGNYTSLDKKKIIVMAVELKCQVYVENSRSTQRSYAKKLIENANADAALIAFHTPGVGNWRLSFVRLDYEMKIDKGKLKTAENMTPARRYSFLVGKDEPCHTAIERFRLFIDKNATCPTLDEIESAFSVEAVTKEFFELYREKFLQLRDCLEKNTDFMEEAKLHNFSSAQFAKKLMGQIVFLYFLQKKGWLGVKAWRSTLTEKEYKSAFFAKGSKSRELIPKVYVLGEDGLYHVSKRGLDELDNADEVILASCVKGEPWGSGPHNFMRRLFDLADSQNVNFFEDYLEPLFYNALNVNRGEQGYDPALHCRIPFLSGGLFEPIDGYDWKHNNFAIPNELFSNKMDKNDRLANGILDIFDRYNFTMSEDEPLEREVAIDPEMLGKVFENLLDVNDRKSKGAFYTPREIVHYMCQESLINYLTNAMQVKEMAIRDFILYSDFMKDKDASVLKQAEEGDTYELWISEELFELNPDGTIKTNRIQELDKALQDVHVADPAVGSGAFPLGMLNEIVRARQSITTYMDIAMKIIDPKGASREIRYRRINERSARQLKYDTIRNCIFAVDIEPSAVDIAQLRLWLALVIDDEIDPDAVSALDGHRNPLPLPNLECNILCGNSLIDEFEGIKLINESELISNTTAGQVDIYQSGFDAALERLIAKQQELFKCDNTDTKARLLEEIADLRNSVIMTQMEGANPDTLERYEATKDMASKPFVLWQLDFAKVFREKGGFDIVIGNPPYGIVYDTMTKPIYEKLYSTFKRNNDLYVAFYHKSFELAAEEGIISLITPNTFLNGDYFKKLRELLKNYRLIEFTDFKEMAVFADPTVYVSIGILRKTVFNMPYQFIIRGPIENKLSFQKYLSSVDAINDQPIKVYNPLFENIVNYADFLLSEEFDVKDIGFNYWSKGNGKQRSKNSVGARVLYSGMREHSEDIPYLKGRDINRFSKGIPSNFLRHNYSDFLNPEDTFRFTAEVMENKDKIIYRQTANRIIATLDHEGMYNDKTIHCIVPKDSWSGISLKYILALLNSCLFEYVYREISQETEGRAFAQVKTVYIKQLPIKRVTHDIEQQIDEFVDTIVLSGGLHSCDRNLYDAINDIIFDVYGIASADRKQMIQETAHLKENE